MGLLASPLASAPSMSSSLVSDSCPERLAYIPGRVIISEHSISNKQGGHASRRLLQRLSAPTDLSCV